VKAGAVLAVLTLTAGSLFAPGGALAAAHGSGPPPVPGARAATDSLNWGKCPDDIYVTDPRLQCAMLRVPLDYRAPRGRTIEIAVSRLPTAKPELRRGVMLLNPGGPGLAFLGMPAYFAPMMPQSVRDRFDLIGFDPRFAGHGKPALSCGVRITRVEQGLPWPVRGGVRENARIARDTAAQCIRAAGDVLPHITAANNARDMNEIRKALGEERISYLGYENGSLFGAIYAQLFPRHTDRIVLDSAIDPNRLGWHFFRSWGPGVEIRFPDFARWVAARDGVYHLGATPEQVRARYFQLGRLADDAPIPLPEGSLWDVQPLLTGNLFRQLNFDSLAFDFRFPDLARVWQAVQERDQATLARLVPPMLSRELANPNFLAMAWALTCSQRPWPRSLHSYARAVRKDSRRYPLAGGMAGNITPCAYWPAPAERQPRITDRGPANILVVQMMRDSFTAYTGGLGMRRALGNRSRLVSIDAGGHAAYLVSRNPCADETTSNFLVTGTLPAGDVFCPAAPPFPAR
jgi:pimeloyl-ACP methyl ester carboxylesterase